MESELLAHPQGTFNPGGNRGQLNRFSKPPPAMRTKSFKGVRSGASMKSPGGGQHKAHGSKMRMAENSTIRTAGLRPFPRVPIQGTVVTYFFLTHRHGLKMVHRLLLQPKTPRMAVLPWSPRRRQPGPRRARRGGAGPHGAGRAHGPVPGSIAAALGGLRVVETRVCLFFLWGGMDHVWGVSLGTNLEETTRAGGIAIICLQLRGP